MEIPTKKTFGGCHFARTMPTLNALSPNTKVLNIDISFEEALKLSLAMSECVRKLNSYKRSTTAGKRSGLNVAVYLGTGEITIKATLQKAKDTSGKRASANKGSKTSGNKGASANGDRRTKRAEVIRLLGREHGVKSSEIMDAMGWQAHTVRGFISVLGSKGGLKIESTKNDAKERIYRLESQSS
jgi:hypothetical protein